MNMRDAWEGITHCLGLARIACFRKIMPDAMNRDMAKFIPVFQNRFPLTSKSRKPQIR